MSELEIHFTTKEIAKAWKLHETTVQKIFIDEPGVLRIGDPTKHRAKRNGYVTLRIPESVLKRVYEGRTHAR